MATETPTYPDALELTDGEELLLLGVTGSTAYGLSHEGSDVDRLGIYTVPTTALFRLGFNMAKASHVSPTPMMSNSTRSASTSGWS